MSRIPVGGRVVVLIGLGCAVGSPSPAASQSSDRDAVVAVIDGFHGALADGDSTRALGFLADDVAILESGGVEDKTHYRSGHLAGDMRFASAIRRERGPVAVTVNGDVAWAHSTNVAQGTVGERQIDSQGAELIVLSRREGSWKIQAVHWSSRQRRAPSGAR